MNTKPFLKNSFLLSSAALLEGVCNMVCSFVVALLLGPSIQGAWQTVRLIRLYTDYAPLGQTFGMRREAAVAVGANDRIEVERQRDTAFTWNTGVMLVMAAVIALSAVVVPMGSALSLAMWTIAATAGISGASIFFNMWLKTIGQFGSLATVSLVTGVSSLAMAGLTYLLGFPALLCGYVVSAAAVVIVMAALCQDRPRLRFFPGAWKRSMAVGVPFFLIAVSQLLFISVDRIVAVALLGFAGLGFYSISTMLFMPIQTAVASVVMVLLPSVCHQYGRDGSPKKLERFLTPPLAAALVGLPAIAACAALLIPALVHRLLPAYASGILPAQIAIIGLPFAAAAGFCTNILLASRRQWDILVAAIAASLVKIGLMILLLMKSRSLEGIALSSTLAHIVNLLLLYMAAARETRTRLLTRIITMAEALIASGLCIVLLCYLQDIRRLFAGNTNLLTLWGAMATLIIVPVAWAAWRVRAHLHRLGVIAQVQPNT